MKTRIALLLVLAAAFAARFTGIHFGLPGLFHQDEPIVVNHALAYASGDFNPHFFKIPPLASYVLSGAYGLYFAALAVFAGVSREAFAVSFFADPSPFYLIGRTLLGAVLGTASVWALYKTAERVAGRPVALGAAGLFAFSFMHVRDSHYIYVDIPMIFCMLMAASELAAYSEGGSEKRVWKASAWGGAAVAFKYIAAPIALPVAMAVFMRGGAGAGKKSLLVFKAALVMLGTYAALNPFSLIDGGFFMKELLTQAKAEASVPFLHHLRYSLYEGHGEVATIFGIAGLVALWLKRPHARWLAAFPVAYYLMIAHFSQYYERYALPIVPFLCLSAAFLMAECLHMYRYKGVRLIVGAVLAATAVGPSLLKVVHLDHLLLRDDTRTLATRWIEENLPEGSGITLDHPFFSPRLRQTGAQVAEKAGYIDSADPHAALKDKKLRFMLTAQAGKKAYRVFYLAQPGEERAPFLLASPPVARDAGAIAAVGASYFVRYRHPGEDAFFMSQIRPRAQLVASFSPYPEAARTYTADEWANVALPFRSKELFSRRRTGPYLEIYKVGA
jgi:hypothetical protein